MWVSGTRSTPVRSIWQEPNTATARVGWAGRQGPERRAPLNTPTTQRVGRTAGAVGVRHGGEVGGEPVQVALRPGGEDVADPVGELIEVEAAVGARRVQAVHDHLAIGVGHQRLGCLGHGGILATSCPCDDSGPCWSSPAPFGLTVLPRRIGDAAEVVTTGVAVPVWLAA